MTEKIDILEQMGHLNKKLKNKNEKDSFTIVFESFLSYIFEDYISNTDLFEKFLIDFNKLKKLVGNTPQRVEIKAANEEGYEFKRLVVDLMLRYKKIDNNINKRTITVPDGFNKAKREFSNYHDAISKVGHETLKKCSEIIDRVAGENDIKIPSWFYDVLKKEVFYGFEANFEWIYYALENMICSYNDNDLKDNYEHALKSLEFLEQEVLGKNLSTLYNRWKSILPVFIPRHVVAKNPETLLKLYDEAIRTYVSGNYVACIAMCRSLFEYILIKYYGAKIKTDDDLSAIISQAQKKYEFLNKLGLHKKRIKANDLIHNYNGENIEDKTVLDFIKTVKSLIEGIPVSKITL